MMSHTLLSSPILADRAPKANWDTLTRVKVRMLYKAGHGYRRIRNETTLSKSTIRNIIKSGSSRRTRKGKVYKKKLVSARELRRVLRYVTASWDNRCALYARIKAECNVQASTTTLRRALKAAGYRRCIACPRPFISRKQALKRFNFARKYRWWGTQQWKVVLWSDEATFETEKRGRIWITRRPKEKRCNTCIKSVYQSGRTSVMIWGAVGWDWKSPLVFLEKGEGRKGVCSQVYLEQVLEGVIFPYYDSLSKKRKEEFIFMEDGSKVHKGKARLPKLNKGIGGFDWPPSSPDLNPIEKVWRWMKHEITKMAKPPTTIGALKKVLQEL
jgi:transposase